MTNHGSTKFIVPIVLSALCTGCFPYITAVNLDTGSNEPEGIPFYLPKPYLVVSKNVHYIPTPTVGLTQTIAIPNSFDAGGSATPGATDTGTKNPNNSQKNGAANNQDNAGANNQNAAQTPAQQGAANVAQKQAKKPSQPQQQKPQQPQDPSQDPNANANSPTNPGSTKETPNSNSTQVLGPASIMVVPPTAIPDGLQPETFYTYQILYLPDLTQKYGLRIRGGAGEMRVTENLVNGWMHTGPGPVYTHDSLTSANVTAVGSAATEVLDSVAKLIMPAPAAAAAVAGATTKKTVGVGPQSLDVGQLNLDLEQHIGDYAEVYIFEPQVQTGTDGKKSVIWSQLEHIKFDRNVVGISQQVNPASQNQDLRTTQIQKTIRDALAKVSIPDGGAGGAFTVANTTVNTAVTEITVAVGTNGKSMARSYTKATLTIALTSSICGALQEQGISPCPVIHINADAVTSKLKS
jgi:hypothetical protein